MSRTISRGKSPGLTGIRAGGSSDWATTEKGSRPLIAGTSVKVAVQYTDNGKIPHSWIKLYAGSEAEVKAGTAKLLAQREGQDGERDALSMSVETRS